MDMKSEPTAGNGAPGFQLAIDGPAGVGKSTVARAVANRMGFTYVDSGAMYRAIGLKIARLTESGSHPDWGEVARASCIEFSPSQNGQRVYLDGEDVSHAIRTPASSDWSSRVSADPAVRQALTGEQKRLASLGSVVMEGRDIGTVVLPSAPLKVFLVASEEERARRRARDLEAAGQNVDLEILQRDIRERDRRDMTRADSPLRKAEDAVELNTDHLTADDVVERIVALVRERL